jgi:hypothetical protein
MYLLHHPQSSRSAAAWRRRPYGNSCLPLLSTAEAVETLPDRGGDASATYGATFFGQWSKRGASSAVVVALEGGRRARVGFEDGYGCAKRGFGHFSNMARGAGAFDRLLPRT